MTLSWYRMGYIAGVTADAQRYVFPTKKAERRYQRGYAKGLGTLYFRILMKATD